LSYEAGHYGDTKYGRLEHELLEKEFSDLKWENAIQRSVGYEFHSFEHKLQYQIVIYFCQIVK